MISKDALDLITTISTAGAAVFAGGSALIAAKAVRDSTRAMALNRESIRAQAFLHLINYEREIHFSKGMDVIRALGDEVREADLKNEQIREVVDFLNHVAHIIRWGYVTPMHILYLYTTSIVECRDKLLGEGKWLDMFRDKAHSPNYYLHFETLCKNLEALWEGQEANWPNPPEIPPPMYQ